MHQAVPGLQASLAKERCGRAQMVASLKETISGLKAAGDVEGRLKAQAIALHRQIAAAQHAQVAALSASPLEGCKNVLSVPCQGRLCLGGKTAADIIFGAQGKESRK